MQINVRFLDNLKVEASFDDYTIVADQPVRYKGDGLAPSPFDYFLASSAMCAAYFVKVYCKARNIPTDDIRITQNNTIDPDNRYKQSFQIEVELPEDLSEKDREGILAAIERCTVKKVIQNAPQFLITPRQTLGKEDLFKDHYALGKQTRIPGKDDSLENTITKMSELIMKLDIRLEVASWRNPVPHVWSVHLRDADCPMNYTNGKGASKEAALASALGEFIERLSNNYFYNDFYLGPEIANAPFVHYPDEQWFEIPEDDTLPPGLMDPTLLAHYHCDGELKASHLVDTNSANTERGICALPFIRQSDLKQVYIPVNIVGNLFVSNGMSAGNTRLEARVQALSEIFERAVKNQIIHDELALPDVPKEVLESYPAIWEGIQKLEEQGYPIVVKDASLGGRFPVLCVTLLNPRTGGAYASFGAHPLFEVALERSLTELLQGRSFEGLNEMPPPTFNSFAVQEHNNLIDHFIDSTGVISWRFFQGQSDYNFVHWNFSGTTQEEFDHLLGILTALEKEVYIADYEDLGACACRILVPGYSEIYQAEDLVWDNNNRALHFREDILQLHALNDEELRELIERLDESELDDYMPISELIGIAYDEASPWGKLVIAELKALSFLALKDYENAKQFTEMLLTFHDNTDERKKYYRLIDALIDIELQEELEESDFLPVLERLYGQELLEQGRASVKGELRFFGLTPTNLQLDGLDKHQRLLKSYQKLQAVRAKHLVS